MLWVMTAWVDYWRLWQRQENPEGCCCGAQRAAIEAIEDLERVCREHAAITAEKK